MMADVSPIQRILIVDDDPSIRHVLSCNLRAEGFDVRTLEHGRFVCETVRHIMPDLLILDVMMPHRDGLDVLTEIRNDPQIANTPVALLTAKATDGEVWAGWQAGADYYITKPFDLDEILNFVRYLGVGAA